MAVRGAAVVRAWKRGDHRKYVRRLRRVHVTLGMLGVCLLGLSVVAIAHLRTRMTRMATDRAPAYVQSSRILTGVRTAVAAVRGTVAVGDPRYLEEREAVWERDVRGGLAALRELGRDWDEPGQARLDRLAVVLRDLETEHRWVEEVASAPGNEPARAAYLDRVRPIADQVGAGSTSLIELEKQRGGEGAAALTRLGIMADFRYALAQGVAALLDFIDSGAAHHERRFRELTAEGSRLLAELRRPGLGLEAEQRDVLAWTGPEHEAYLDFAEEVVAARTGEKSNLARYWLRTRVAESERLADATLAEVLSQQDRAMAAEMSAATLVSNVATGVAILLLLGMAVATARAGRQGRHLTDAIVASGERLTAALGELERQHRELQATRRSLEKSVDDLASSNRELDEFAYIASHDLREPLRGIHNYARFVIEDCAEQIDEEAQRKLDTISRLAHRLDSLIDTLLQYSRLGRVDLAFEPTDLGAVVADVVDTLHVSLAERGVEVRVREPLPVVVCDRARIGEVFRNLVSNAMKYTDEEAAWIEIGVRTAPRRDDVPDDVPIFSVRDNGIGIRPEHLDSIFRIFKRLHGRDKYGGGTGAGLTIVKKIIERHGGRVWVESVPGEGTAFLFTLGAAVGTGDLREPSLTGSIAGASVVERAGR